MRPSARPHGPGDLEAGGALEMLRVVGQDNADLGAATQGQRFEVAWVPVADPLADPEGFVAPTEKA